MFEFTRNEVELLNAFNSVPSGKQHCVLNLVKKYTEENKRPKYKYTSRSQRIIRGAIEYDRGEMIYNGIPGRDNYFEGYCYIGVDFVWKDHYKIGRTNNPFCHTRESRAINPNYKVSYRTRNIYQDSRKLEAEIHNLLSKNRVDPEIEWFELTEKELAQLIKKYDFVKLEDLQIK